MIAVDSPASAQASAVAAAVVVFPTPPLPVNKMILIAVASDPIR